MDSLMIFVILLIGGCGCASFHKVQREYVPAWRVLDESMNKTRKEYVVLSSSALLAKEQPWELLTMDSMRPRLETVKIAAASMLSVQLSLGRWPMYGVCRVAAEAEGKCEVIVRADGVVLATGSCEVRGRGVSEALCAASLLWSLPPPSPGLLRISASLLHYRAETSQQQVAEQGLRWRRVQGESIYNYLELGVPWESAQPGEWTEAAAAVPTLTGLRSLRLRVQFGPGLRLNAVRMSLPAESWRLRTDLKPEKNSNGGGGTGYIKLKNYKAVDEDEDVVNRVELVRLNFTALKPPSATGGRNHSGCFYCLKIAIVMTEVGSGAQLVFFDQNQFRTHNLYTPIPVDPLDMTMAVFTTEVDKSKVGIELLVPRPPVTRSVVTYFVSKLGVTKVSHIQCRCSVWPAEVECKSDNGSRVELVPRDDRGEGVVARLWSLPLSVKEWRGVVHDLQPHWRIANWRLLLSDPEMNPVTNWRVRFAGGHCSTMFQIPQLRVAVRIARLDAGGTISYLGGDGNSSWLEVTTDLIGGSLPDVSVSVKGYPGIGVVSDDRGGAVVTGNVTLYSSTNEASTGVIVMVNGSVVASQPLSVVVGRWATVSAVELHCLGGSGSPITIDTDPGYRLLAWQQSPGPSGCAGLWGRLLYDDRSFIWLSSVPADSYNLSVAGLVVKNGASPPPGLLGNKTEVVLSDRCEGTVMWSGRVTISGMTESGLATTSSVAKTVSSGLSWRQFLILGVAMTTVVLFVLNVTVCVAKRHSMLLCCCRRHKSSSLGDQKSGSQGTHPPLLPPPGPLIGNKTHGLSDGGSSGIGGSIPDSGISTTVDTAALVAMPSGNRCHGSIITDSANVANVYGDIYGVPGYPGMNEHGYVYHYHVGVDRSADAESTATSLSHPSNGIHSSSSVHGNSSVYTAESGRGSLCAPVDCATMVNPPRCTPFVPPSSNEAEICLSLTRATHLSRPPYSMDHV